MIAPPAQQGQEPQEQGQWYAEERQSLRHRLVKRLMRLPNGQAARRRRNKKRSEKDDVITIARHISGQDTDRNLESERKSMIRFLAYLKPNMPIFAMASLCGVSLYLGPLLIPACIGYAIDHFLKIRQPELGSQAAHATNNILYRGIDLLLHHFVAPTASPEAQLNFLLGTLMCFLPLWSVLVFFRAYLAGAGGQKVIFKLRNDLYEHIQTLPLAFFQKTLSGSVVSRMTSDIASAQNFIGNACTNLWMDSLAVIILGGFLFSIDSHLACVAFAILPLWILSVKIFGTNIRKHSLAVQEGLSELSGAVQEKVSGVTVVKAFARERGEMLSFLKLHRALLDRSVNQVHANAMNMMASNLLVTLAPVTVVMYGAHEVFTGRLSVGTLLMFYVMLGTFYNPLARITDLSAVIASSSAAIERIFQIFDEKPDIVDAENAIELPKPVHGRIELDNVDFCYGSSERKILKCINLTIEPGEIVAFVGPSGAGKSTLVQLLPRFYDVTSGEIKVDNFDVREIKIKSLRDQIGMVLQDNILFTGTIRDNILYGRPSASEQDVFQAASDANADGFINDLPDGYETQIGERGSKLSGGQKQRIAITRAFLKDPPILILDEATSALDSESEKQIQLALNRLMEGRTTLIIAHRLSTIMHADKIVVMKHGKIVQVGNHTDLLERGGVYAELYKAQHQHLDMDAETASPKSKPKKPHDKPCLTPA